MRVVRPQLDPGRLAGLPDEAHGIRVGHVVLLGTFEQLDLFDAVPGQLGQGSFPQGPVPPEDQGRYGLALLDFLGRVERVWCAHFALLSS